MHDRAPHVEKQRVVSLGWQSQQFSEIIKAENIGETGFANSRFIPVFTKLPLISGKRQMSPKLNLTFASFGLKYRALVWGFR